MTGARRAPQDPVDQKGKAPAAFGGGGRGVEGRCHDCENFLT